MARREWLRSLQTTADLSAVQRATGLHRRTIRRNQQWAATQGLRDKPLPPVEALQALTAATLEGPPPPQTVSSAEPYREAVAHLHAQGAEGTAIWQRLRERGSAGTLSSACRFLHRLEPPRPSATVRVERGPGREARVDCGDAGRTLDPATGALRKTWAVGMPLAYSRHQPVEFAFDQTLRGPDLSHVDAHARPAPGGRAVAGHARADAGLRVRPGRGRTPGRSRRRCRMELNRQLSPKLKPPRLSGALATLDARHRQALAGQWASSESLERPLEGAIERRAQKHLALRVRRAALNTTQTLEGFDRSVHPTINRRQVLQPGRRRGHPPETQRADPRADRRGHKPSRPGARP
jgi:hypothetical protein